MSPGHKRQVSEEFVSGGRCTARATCRHFGLHRSTFAYEAKQPDAWLARLKAALRRVSNQHPEMGYPKVTKLLKDEGWKVGTRMVQRLRRELGLAVPAKKPKKRRQGVSTGLPTKATHRGPCMDLGLRSRYYGAWREATNAQYNRRVHSGMPEYLCGPADQCPESASHYLRAD